MNDSRVKAAIKDFLLQHKGKTNAVKRKVLCVRFPALTERVIRQIVEDLVVKDQEPIASSVHGYFYINSLEELVISKKYLDAKAEAIAIRKNILDRNFLLYAKKNNISVSKPGMADLFKIEPPQSTKLNTVFYDESGEDLPAHVAESVGFKVEED